MKDVHESSNQTFMITKYNETFKRIQTHYRKEDRETEYEKKKKFWKGILSKVLIRLHHSYHFTSGYLGSGSKFLINTYKIHFVKLSVKGTKSRDVHILQPCIAPPSPLDFCIIHKLFIINSTFKGQGPTRRLQFLYYWFSDRDGNHTISFVCTCVLRVLSIPSHNVILSPTF